MDIRIPHLMANTTLAMDLAMSFTRAFHTQTVKQTTRLLGMRLRFAGHVIQLMVVVVDLLEDLLLSME